MEEVTPGTSKAKSAASVYALWDIPSWDPAAMPWKALWRRHMKVLWSLTTADLQLTVSTQPLSAPSWTSSLEKPLDNSSPGPCLSDLQPHERSAQLIQSTDPWETIINCSPQILECLLTSKLTRTITLLSLKLCLWEGAREEALQKRWEKSSTVYPQHPKQRPGRKGHRNCSAPKDLAQQLT